MIMIDRKQLWSLAEETMRAFGPFYQQSMREAIQDSGVPDDWFGLSLARGSDPAPFTVERFHALFPYTAQEWFPETLETLAREELLERVGEGAYRLTDLGRETIATIFGAAHRELGAIDPLPVDEVDQLNSLLYRLVQATLEAPEPEEKWAIAYSRWTDPGEGAARSVKTDQYLTDLVRFRDDAHIAAWKPYGVSGHAWEALTFIWRGEASTAEELAEKLPFRRHSVETYAEALAGLVGRGWVEETSDGFRIAEKGQALRQQAEEETDRIFFAPWACLDAAETAQLHDLLTRLRHNLQEMAEDDVDAT
jgi:DNA-binding MarR family transcriptional regulator